jgi:hypothetical protein
MLFANVALLSCDHRYIVRGSTLLSRRASADVSENSLFRVSYFRSQCEYARCTYMRSGCASNEVVDSVFSSFWLSVSRIDEAFDFRAGVFVLFPETTANPSGAGRGTDVFGGIV